jgi:hypothetical protein
MKFCQVKQIKFYLMRILSISKSSRYVTEILTAFLHFSDTFTLVFCSNLHMLMERENLLCINISLLLFSS